MSRFAQQVLAVVHRLQGKAFPFAIRRELLEGIGVDASSRAVNVMLAQLEGAGWVISRLVEATPQRGGPTRRYYEITPAGEAALVAEEAA